MKKRLALIAALALCFLLCLSEAALADLNLAGVRAIPNQKLSFRTGPNTAFAELDTLSQDTPIVALELEEGNGVTWVLVEFEYYGSRMRAYTGLKRMSLTGYIPYADHYNLSRRLVLDGQVYTAPDLNATVRDVLPAGTSVTFLGFEGAYCFIEYRWGGELDRGYVRQEDFWVDQYEFAEYFPENPGDAVYAVSTYSPVYAEPSERSEIIAWAPFDASAAILFDEWLYSSPDDWIPLYYGGLRGYGRHDDFCDLRFPDPATAHDFISNGGW